MKAILDTSVLIATDVPPLDGDLAISTASLAELHFGVLVTTDPTIRGERLARLTYLQRSFSACLSMTPSHRATGNSRRQWSRSAGTREPG